jgi:hypothetical protein
VTRIPRLLADISGHIARDHLSRPGAHATAAQHRAWRAANPELKAANNARYRSKKFWTEQLRLRVLQIVIQRDAPLARDALAQAVAELTNKRRPL